MFAPLRRKRARPRRTLQLRILFIVAFTLTAVRSNADPVPIYQGRWTPVTSSASHWPAVPIHMALLPGDGTSFTVVFEQPDANAMATTSVPPAPAATSDSAGESLDTFAEHHSQRYVL